eukprot:SAG11_NODE_517_length_8815_cov_35.866797_6_plen_553_part_00
MTKALLAIYRYVETHNSPMAAFRTMDGDGSGQLDHEELKLGLRALKLGKSFKLLGNAELDIIVNTLDWCAVPTRLPSARKCSHLCCACSARDLTDAPHSIGRTGDGKVSCQELLDTSFACRLNAVREKLCETCELVLIPLALFCSAICYASAALSLPLPIFCCALVVAVVVAVSLQRGPQRRRPVRRERSKLRRTRCSLPPRATAAGKARAKNEMASRIPQQNLLWRSFCGLTFGLGVASHAVHVQFDFQRPRAVMPLRPTSCPTNLVEGGLGWATACRHHTTASGCSATLAGFSSGSVALYSRRRRRLWFAAPSVKEFRSVGTMQPYTFRQSNCRHHDRAVKHTHKHTNRCVEDAHCAPVLGFLPLTLHSGSAVVASASAEGTVHLWRCDDLGAAVEGIRPEQLAPCAAPTPLRSLHCLGELELPGGRRAGPSEALSCLCAFRSWIAVAQGDGAVGLWTEHGELESWLLESWLLESAAAGEARRIVALAANADRIVACDEASRFLVWEPDSPLGWHGGNKARIMPQLVLERGDERWLCTAVWSLSFETELR